MKNLTKMFIKGLMLVVWIAVIPISFIFITSWTIASWAFDDSIGVGVGIEMLHDLYEIPIAIIKGEL